MAKFSVDTHLFRELGELLVGRESTALIELVKNAYDADATEVTVFGQDLGDPKRGVIQISDNGVGMDLTEIDGALAVGAPIHRDDTQFVHDDLAGLQDARGAEKIQGPHYLLKRSV